MTMITLNPGEVARANDVNNNFAELQSMLGALSTPDRIQSPAEFLMGGRQNVLFTGTQDTGDEEDSYFQITYNADYNYSPSSGTWKYQRIVPSLGASALKMGAGEFSVYATSNESTNLNSAMVPVFKIKLTQSSPSTDYIYVPKSVHFQHADEETDDIGNYRLTYVPFLSPNAIYDGQALTAAQTIKKATDFGASSHAKAISISCHVLADAGEDAQIKFYQNRATPSDRFGYIVTAQAGKRGSGWGIVPLGEGSRQSEFYISRTAAFDAVSAYVVGYWV